VAAIAKKIRTRTIRESLVKRSVIKGIKRLFCHSR
jgi:hypothetical protein